MEETKYQPSLQDVLGITKELAADLTALVERVSELEEEVAELRSKAGRIGWSNS